MLRLVPLPHPLPPEADVTVSARRLKRRGLSIVSIGLSIVSARRLKRRGPWADGLRMMLAHRVVNGKNGDEMCALAPW